MTDPVISSLIREIREQKYTISSLPISPSIYPTAISALFLISAFSLLGPILRINGKKPDFDKEVWIMAIDHHGRFGWLLNSAQILVALIAAAMPLWVTFDQHRLIQLLDPQEQMYWWIFMSGGPAATAAMCILCFVISRAKAVSAKLVTAQNEGATPENVT